MTSYNFGGFVQPEWVCLLHHACLDFVIGSRPASYASAGPSSVRDTPTAQIPLEELASLLAGTQW